MITLDAVATNPDLAREVPRETLMRAMMACVLALVGEPKPGVAMDRALSQTLTTEEAARLIGISRRTLARGARSTFQVMLLPTGTRRLAWSRQAIERWQRDSPKWRDPVRYSWLKKPAGSSEAGRPRSHGGSSLPAQRLSTRGDKEEST